jgi:fructoselysine-6-P-deglycase FrlB-like protein
MNHHDAEMTEVVVVLDDLSDEQTQEVVKQLQTAGLQVSSVDNDQSTVGGTIDAQKVHDLKHVPHVRYVRMIMSYTADYPPGDPRDKDGPEEQIENGDD